MMADQEAMTEQETIASAMLALRRAANALPDDDRLQRPLLKLASALELRTARRGFTLAGGQR